MNVGRQQLELHNVDFGQLLSRSNPYHLCLLCVHLKSVAAHQWFNFLRAADKPLDSCPRIRGSSAEMDLCIIGIRVSLHVLPLDDIQQFCCVKKEQKRSKHGTLWDTVDQLHDGRQLPSECHLLRPVREEGSYITLHYITLSFFHTPFTPKVTSGASTKLCICQCKQMSFQLPFESTCISKFLESKRKIIPCFRPGIREASLTELALQYWKFISESVGKSESTSAGQISGCRYNVRQVGRSTANWVLIQWCQMCAPVVTTGYATKDKKSHMKVSLTLTIKVNCQGQVIVFFSRSLISRKLESTPRSFLYYISIYIQPEIRKVIIVYIYDLESKITKFMINAFL